MGRGGKNVGGYCTKEEGKIDKGHFGVSNI